MNRARQFLFRKALLVEAVVLLTIAKIGLHWAPFARWRRFFEIPVAQKADQTDLDVATIDLIARAVHRAGRRVLGDASCLPQALAGVWMLRRRGCPAVLQFGVRKTPDNRFAAHAWVEYNQVTVLGLASEAYQRYTTLHGVQQSPKDL